MILITTNEITSINDTEIILINTSKIIPKIPLKLHQSITLNYIGQ